MRNVYMYLGLTFVASLLIVWSCVDQEKIAEVIPDQVKVSINTNPSNWEFTHCTPTNTDCGRLK